MIEYFSSWCIWDVLFLVFMYFWGVGMVKGIREEKEE